MSAFSFSERSLRLMDGVHPDLVKVVRRAMENTPSDFVVLEGVRSPERQQQLFQNGASRTLNSRHLTGHAIDLAPWIDQQIPWQDWPAFAALAQTMKLAARELGIPITWGGDWKNLKDGPHFELPRESYP
ncbi:peptidase M15 [Chromobacterium sp. ATCC 53434]|uniref:M15 family metallopeptidase n=1 Tax=Chromobacterium sp. (strain ATCC 53434 / SC 14030) TaxID=2059672 RepID=UPI000C77C053|nr:M15 family metallopeptidase [Chromobacterium sp. ATCC 53434]AUH51663.1 peptidase M15 [Chromobacterium sp. ATCC 53434]